MHTWVAGKNLKYLPPSETVYFAKLAFALAIHEVDEEVINRQRTEWMDDLQLMQEVQGTPASASGPSIQLPPGVQLQPTPPK